MRSWFPLTDYDFWAYIASGAVALAAAFYSITGVNFLTQTSWPAPLVIACLLTAYFVGHALASMSMFLIEEQFARSFLSSPTTALLGRLPRSVVPKAVVRVLAARYYASLPPLLASKVLAEVRKRAGGLPDEHLSDETVFQVAYAATRENEDARQRADDFRNKYGFCRNMAMSAGVALLLLGARFLYSAHPIDLALASAAFALGYVMISRFLMFYANFAAEVLRSLIR